VVESGKVECWLVKEMRVKDGAELKGQGLGLERGNSIKIFAKRKLAKIWSHQRLSHADIPFSILLV